MKKTLTTKRLFYRIVQTSFLQIVFTAAFSSLALAIPSNGQEILERKVSLNASSVRLEQVLQQIETAVHVKFSYNSRKLQLKRLVTIRANQEPLSEVLKNLFNPLKIKYLLVSNQIVLRKTPDEENSFLGTSPPDQAPESQTAERVVKGIVTDEIGRAHV